MKLRFLLIFVGVLLYGSTFAQTILVKGRVTDETGGALPGVTVKVKGSSTGVATDGQGRFQLSAAQGTALLISAIGYAPTTATVSGELLEVRLIADNKQLDEVVVTALGLKREKRTLTYSTQQMNAQEIADTKESNVVNALAGKIAGVQITSSSGSPGASSKIVIRGNTSINANNQALFVVDGVPINNDESGNAGGAAAGPGVNRASDIDPATIETINILKGSAATALYGSAGARGVVLITTKNGGINKKPLIAVSSDFSFEKGIFPERQTTWAQGSNGTYIDGEATKASTSWGPAMAGLTVNGQQVPTYNPYDFYQTGHTTNNNINISGGGKASDYFVSYSFLNQTGIIPKADYTKHAFFVKQTDHITDKLSFTFQMGYTNSEQNRLPEGQSNGPQFVVFVQPVSWNPYPILNADGTPRLYRYSRNSPLWSLDHINNRSVVNRFLPITTLNYKANSWLTFTERLGADIYTEQDKYTEDPSAAIGLPGQIIDQNVLSRQFNNDLIANAEKQFGKFKLNVLLGNNFISSYSQVTTQKGAGLVIDNFDNISAGSSVSTTENHYLSRKIGFYGQANVDYNKFLILSLTERYDGSSVLASDKQFYSYGSVAGSFIASELLPEAVNKIMNFSKIRLSYATVGNDVVGAYSLLTPYNVASRNTPTGAYTFPYNNQPGFLISDTYGNSNLTNERLYEYEGGLELKFLNSRIGFEGSYFSRKSVDGIIPGVGISNATGYASTTVSTASVRNRGVELLLTGTPLKSKDFSWDITLNFTKVKSKVLAITPGVDRLGRIMVGEPYNIFYGTQYARNSQGQLLINSAGLPYASSDQGIVGDANPDYLAGMNNSLRYKNFTFNFFFDMKKGGDVQNDVESLGYFYGTAKATANRAPIVVDGVSAATGLPNTISVSAQTYYQNKSSVYESSIQDGTYIKLRQVGISYALPAALLGKSPFKAVSLGITGRNLWIYSPHFTGGDPEVNSYGTANGVQGIYSFSTPTSRSIDFSAKLSF